MTSVNSADTSPDAATVVLAGGKEISIRTANPTEVADFLTGSMVEADEDPQAITRRMVEQVMAAGSFGEMLDQAEVKSLRDDFLGIPFTILDAVWYKSTITAEDGKPQGPPMFMVLHVVDNDGQQHRVSTGALMPMTMVYGAQLRGDLSSVAIKGVKRDRPTKAGYYPINLVRA